MSRIKSYQQFYEQKVAGGLSAGMSIEDIAKHHGVGMDELKPEYDKGIKVEMEHTKDPEIAAEIARDHLYEDPKYYTKLATIEEGRKPKGAPSWSESDATDAEGRFRDLSPKELAAWLIKTRKRDLRKITGSLNQQIVFNRKEDPKYAEKMEKTRKEVYKQLGREDLLEDMKNITTFDRFLNENAQAGNDAGKLMLDLLYVRDQAHIFHWQTESYARHQALGGFYDDYIELLDDVAEQIFGKMGRFYLQDRGAITFIDYSEQNLMDYLDRTESIFRSEIRLVVPEEGNGEIYNKIEEILSLIDKLRYLLTLG